jgi:hypothetical protein
MGESIPKKRQALFDDLAKYLQIGDDDAVEDLLRNKSPMTIRDELSTGLGQHVRKNYDNPLNAFENKKLLEQVPVEYTKLPDNIAGKYNLSENKIYLPHENLEIPSRQMGNKMHEFGHADEVANKGFKAIAPLEETTSALKGSGLPDALKAFGDHHQVGFFEKEAWQKLLKNGKLAAGYLAPVMKGLGVAGMGLGALGAYNKAQAGDNVGAVSDIADMTPVLGEVKQMVEPESLGKGDDNPEKFMKAQQLKEKLYGR